MWPLLHSNWFEICTCILWLACDSDIMWPLLLVWICILWLACDIMRPLLLVWICILWLPCDVTWPLLHSWICILWLACDIMWPLLHYNCLKYIPCDYHVMSCDHYFITAGLKNTTILIQVQHIMLSMVNIGTLNSKMTTLCVQTYFNKQQIFLR